MILLGLAYFFDVTYIAFVLIVYFTLIKKRNGLKRKIKNMDSIALVGNETFDFISEKKYYGTI